MTSSFHHSIWFTHLFLFSMTNELPAFTTVSPERGNHSDEPIEDTRKRALVTPEIPLPSFHDDHESFSRIPRLPVDTVTFRYLFDLLDVPQDLLDRLPLPKDNAFEAGGNPEFENLEDIMKYLEVAELGVASAAIPTFVRQLPPHDALNQLRVNDPDLHEDLTSSLTMFLSRKISKAIIDYSQRKEQREHFVLDTAIESLASLAEEAIDSMEADIDEVDSNTEMESA
jgi:hypothetical protein